MSRAEMTRPGGDSLALAPLAATDVRASRVWGLWATFAWFFGVLLVELAVIAAAGVLYRLWTTAGGQPLDLALPATLLPIATIVAGCCVTGVIVLAARLSRLSVSDYLGLGRPRGRYLALSLVVLVLSLGMTFAASGLGFKLTGAAQSPSVFTSAAYALVLRWVASIIIAPLWEELLFRGFLYRGLSESHLGAKGAIVVTAVLWALVHANRTWFGIVEMTVCGLLYGWLRWRTGSTLTIIVVHSLNNALLLLIAALA